MHVSLKSGAARKHANLGTNSELPFLFCLTLPIILFQDAVSLVEYFDGLFSLVKSSKNLFFLLPSFLHKAHDTHKHPSFGYFGTRYKTWACNTFLADEIHLLRIFWVIEHRVNIIISHY